MEAIFILLLISLEKAKKRVFSRNLIELLFSLKQSAENDVCFSLIEIFALETDKVYVMNKMNVHSIHSGADTSA